MPLFPAIEFLTCGALAAYQVGLTFITESMRRALNSCVSPEKYFAKDRVNEAVQVPVPAESYDPLDLALEAIMG